MEKLTKQNELSPQLMLRGYSVGIFPMSETRDDQNYFWVNPSFRGILPLNSYHIPRSLKKLVRREVFRVTFNKAFEKVVDFCRKKTLKRDNTWINPPIRRAVIELHKTGFAHSVECWHENVLVGGLYGISLGSAFFGESMFSRYSNASKVALVHLLALLRIGRFQLLDTQFTTDHLSQFGAIEISAEEYLLRLEKALKFQSIFHSDPEPKKIEAALNSVLKCSIEHHKNFNQTIEKK